MKYISPFSILEISDEQSGSGFSQRDFFLAKRTLLAEAELSESKTIIRNGRELSKEDILALFDRVSADNPEYHFRVFKNKSLLAFLESGTFDTEMPPDLTDAQEDEDFRKFLKPYFIPVWSEALLAFYRTRNFDALTELLHVIKLFAQDMELVELLQPLEGRLEDFNAYAVSYARQINASMFNNTKELDGFFDEDLLRFLNSLPFTFEDLRNIYMISMVNLTVKLFNGGRKGLALSYGNKALILDCDESARYEMESRLEFYRKPQGQPVAGGNDSNSGSWRSYWWVIMVVIAILRIIASESHTSGDSYSSYNQYTQWQRPANTTESPALKDLIDNVHDDVSRTYSSDYRTNEFVKSLAVLLKNKTNSLPEGTDKGPDDPVVTNLQQIIDLSRKNKEHVPVGSTMVTLENHSGYGIIVLYAAGKEVGIKGLPPFGSTTVYMPVGKIALRPFMGTGWEPTKITGALYEPSDSSTELGFTGVKINTGWFKYKLPVERDDSNLPFIYKITQAEKPATIIMDIDQKDYSWAIMGDNILNWQ